MMKFPQTQIKKLEKSYVIPNSYIVFQLSEAMLLGEFQNTECQNLIYTKLEYQTIHPYVDFMSFGHGTSLNMKNANNIAHKFNQKGRKKKLKTNPS